MSILPMQSRLDRPLEIVIGNRDYLDHLEDLNLISEMIRASGLEEKAMEYFVARAERNSAKQLSHSKTLTAQSNGLFILYSFILRKHLNLALRPYCHTLASSPLYQKFCGINRWVSARIPSMSKINSLENALSEKFIEEMSEMFNKNVVFNKTVAVKLGFEDGFNIENLYMDSTCIKANIHYPVDWVLFRDLIRTSMLKVEKIREKGIKVRMPQQPNEYLSGINALCIKMHMAYRIKDAKKKRKSVFREMKRYLKTAMVHSKSHLDKFKEEWKEHGFSYPKACEIISVLEEIQDTYKEVISIAHKRIINEKIISADEKILSIYEEDVHIISKNKEDVKTEFGNTLQLVEQSDGLIVHYDLLKESTPGDPSLGIDSLKSIFSLYGSQNVKSIVADRGYDSKKIKKFVEELEGAEIEYNVLPKNPIMLHEKMQDSEFKAHHKRRALTEAKVAHVKGIADNPMKQKGIRNKKLHMGMAVFTQNLKRLTVIHRQQNAENILDLKQA